MTISKIFLRLAAVWILIACSRPAVAAEGPSLDFGAGAVVVRDVQPGGRVAWMAIARERVSYHTVVKVRRGVVDAGRDGVARIDAPIAASKRAIWAVADLGRGSGKKAKTPDAALSTNSVAIHAASDQETITVESAEIHLLYVNPPHGAWAFDASDGGGNDADGKVDGRITVPLSSLSPIQGKDKAPKQVKRGDVILAIDPKRLRSGEVVVR
jgi:hypothetical protein